MLVGVYDIDRARAREVAAACGSRAFDDLDELLGLVRAVTVAVPTPYHAEVGLRVLGRGIPMLMEKPLAATVPEADELIAEAARQGVQLQVGHIERFNQALRAAEPLLHHPLYLESQRLSLFQPRGTDVAVVLDLMIHDLDLILHLTGGAEAIDVRASGVAVLSPHLDMVNARVEFQGGVVANVTASRMARDRVRRLRIFQANGYLSLDLATGRGDFMRLRDGWRPGVAQELSDIVEFIPLDAPEADALSLELHSFIHAVRGDREAVITGEEGRAALALALRVTDAVTTTPLSQLAAEMTVATARVFLSAGEPSGDLHAAAVVRALRQRMPSAAARCVRRAAHGRGGREREVPHGGLRGLWHRGNPREDSRPPPAAPPHGTRVCRVPATTSSSWSTIPAFTCMSPRPRAAPASRCCTTSRRSCGPGGRSARGALPRPSIVSP